MDQHRDSSDSVNSELVPPRTTITLYEALSIILKRRRLILATTLIAAAGSIAYAAISLLLPSSISYLPNQYTAEAIVLLKPPSDSNNGNSGSNLSGLAALAGIKVSTDSDQNSQLIISLIKQNTFQDRLAQELDFKGHYKKTDEVKAKVFSRQAIERKLKTKYDDSSGLLTLKYTDADRAYATEIVNRAVEILQDRLNRIISDYVAERMKLTEESIREARESMQSAQKNFTDYQQKYGLYDLELSTSASIKRLQEASDQLLSLQNQYNTLSAYRSSDDPQLVRMQQEIQRQKEFIRTLKVGSPDLNSINVAVDKLPDVIAEYTILKQELTIQQGIYASLRQQIETSRIELISGSKVFSIIEKADLPLVKSGPSRGLICIFATAAAFLFAVFAAFAIEYGKILKLESEADPGLKQLLGSLSRKKKG